MTKAERLNQIVTEVSTRYRFGEIDGMLPKPRLLEMQAAVLDALQEINSFPPVTTTTLESLFTEDADTRWTVLLYLGTAKNILHTLIFDFTANGFSQQLGEFSVEDRLDQYRSLYDTINQEFTTRLQGFKESVTKIIRRVEPTNQSLIRPYAGLVSLRRPMRY